MTDPTTLFSYEKHVDSRTLRGETLVVTLGAFGDTGAARALLDDHVLNTLPNRVVGRLDMDQVFDYTGHRPQVVLARDRFTDYEKPEVLLHEVTAPDGQPFFLLTGPEPSFQWERIASAMRIVTEQIGIRRTLLVSAFPAPVPHTRDLHVTRWAGDPADIVVHRPMPTDFRLRSSFNAVLTMRLAEAGHDVVGVLAHVPQYLADIAYPDAAIALLRALGEEGGPDIPVGALEQAAQAVRENIDQQVAQAPQLQQLVAGLEENHDRTLTAGPGFDESDMPSAEELAAEVEQYLAGLGDDEGGRDEPDTDERGTDTDED
ncbi:PAC2 family protein [Brachybacterium sp. EF45031]|uniref:PAC2 family protein n=1 Tax=Brachybacterium sillae TaxID=2810536 RepID=UPI00217DE6A0|nr:PAC2 family protein [Brachybacterium sillae]MCS6710629.1 PAC2 family protein [Brachybacterium sillae]